MLRQGLVCTLKWFDFKKGYGFLTADDPAVGDIMIHRTVFRETNNSLVPVPGGRLVVEAMQVGGRWQATKIEQVGC